MAKQQDREQDPNYGKTPPPAQKPSIGRIVHFALPGHAEPAAALVTGTYEDDSKVDLLVALPYGHPNGHTMARAGILLDDSETPAEHTWHWLPRA